MPKKRQDAIHAFRILNYFVGDLAAATQVRRCFQSPGVTSKASPATIACVNRMCLSYLFLILDKWEEFCDRFHGVIPDDCRGHCKELRKEVGRRKIKQFRNRFVSHIWDKVKNRPLTDAELEAAVSFIVKDDPDTFSAWCNDPVGNAFPNTVISIVEHTRDRIREEFELTESELFPGKDTA